MGRVSDGLKPNELVAKLTKDEWVFTGQQFDNLTKNIGNLMTGKQQSTGMTYQIDNLIKVEHMDKDVNIDNIIDKAIAKLNKLQKDNLGMLGIIKPAF